MRIEEYECSNIKDYLAKTLEWGHNNHFVIFRGHENSDYELIPGIARTPKKKPYNVAELRRIEKEIISQFKTLCNHHIVKEGVNKDEEFEILPLAQHYGLPTRLLDWTSNPLAALYFAVNTISEDMLDGKFCVWAYCIQEDDRRIIDFDNDDKKNPYSVKKTWIFKPKTITNRIHAQAGWFTLHSCTAKPSAKGFIPLEKDKEFQPELARIIISKKHAVQIRKELDILHVNSSTMFPDISGTTSHLSWKVMRKYKHFNDELT